MTASLTIVIRKNHDGPGTALAGTAYPALVELVEAMKAEDPRIIFDSLRPLGDEFWNMIDGERTVAEIAAAVCLEFGFDLSPERFVPLVNGMVESGAVRVIAAESEPPQSRGEEGQ